MKRSKGRANGNPAMISCSFRREDAEINSPSQTSIIFEIKKTMDWMTQGIGSRTWSHLHLNRNGPKSNTGRNIEWFEIQS